MLVHDRSQRHGRGGRRSWPGKRSRPELKLGCGRPVGQRGVWAKGVVVATPALDDDLGLLERIEDLAVEQLVAELTSVTPIERIASATDCPCAVSTSTCRSLATISSGLCRFLDIGLSSTWPKAIPQGGPMLRGQTRSLGRLLRRARPPAPGAVSFSGLWGPARPGPGGVGRQTATAAGRCWERAPCCSRPGSSA